MILFTNSGIMNGTFRVSQAHLFLLFLLPPLSRFASHIVKSGYAGLSVPVHAPPLPADYYYTS